jgi:polyisoprenoid-binding protein YceI
MEIAVKKTIALPLLSLAALTLPSCVQLLMAAYPPPSDKPSSVQPGTYKVEPYHTQVGFQVNHMGFTYFSGEFSGATGTVTLDPKHPAKMAVSVSVPVKTVLTTSPKLDEELVEADWLDAAKYPAMDFKSTSVKLTGANTADVTGMLTLHGVTKPETFHATFVGSGVNILDKAFTAGFEVTGTIKRSDFGVSKYIPLIGDEVKLTIAAAFEK